MDFARPGTDHLRDNVRPNYTSTSISTGAVEAIAVDPTNTNHIYVGTVNGGVWQTQNYTAANPIWTTTTDQLPSLAIMSIAFSPTNANVVYAGTGSLSAYGAMLPIPAPRRTCGRNLQDDQRWHQLERNRRQHVRRLTRFPNCRHFVEQRPDPLRRHHRHLTNSSNAISEGGIYRSDDGGTKWMRISGTGVLPNTGVTALTYNPNFPDQLYAAVPGGLPGVNKNAGIYELDITPTAP